MNIHSLQQRLLLVGLTLVELTVSSALFAGPGTAQVPHNICQNAFRFVRTNDGSNLNLRSSPARPGEDSRIIGSIPNGTEVLFNISNRFGDWAEVTLSDGSRGWVATRYLVRSSAGSTQFNGSMRVKTIDRQPATLYSSLGVGEIGSLDNGDVVTYNNTEGYYTNVTTQQGVTGYVANQLLVCN